MSEPFLDRLSQFTPDAGGLDRDALLFAAGRASARPSRGWQAVAGTLAATQLVSLAMLWPRSGSNDGGRGVGALASQPAALAPASQDPADARLWSAGGGVPEQIEKDQLAADASYPESGPLLRAFGAPPDSLLN